MQYIPLKICIKSYRKTQSWINIISIMLVRKSKQKNSKFVFTKKSLYISIEYEMNENLINKER